MHLRGAESLLDVDTASTNDKRIALKNTEVFEAQVGMSLALDSKEGGYDLSAYVRGVGQMTTSAGYKMAHWHRMVALLYPGRGETAVIGRAAFDDTTVKEAVNKEGSQFECLVVSRNQPIQNPHTFVQTESLNVLLVVKKDETYVRVGVGELFVRSRDKVIEAPPRTVVPRLVLA